MVISLLIGKVVSFSFTKIYFKFFTKHVRDVTVKIVTATLQIIKLLNYYNVQHATNCVVTVGLI